MKKLMCISCLIFIVSILGCEDSAPKKSSSMYTDPVLNKARAGIKTVMPYSKGNKSYELMNSVLKEPDFTGPLKEWGCIAIFDSSGNLSEVKTLKTVDFKTGKRYPIRKYTPEELNLSRAHILEYQRMKGWSKTMNFPIMSHSIKLAIAELLLKPAGSSDVYTIGRGDECLEVSVIKGSTKKILAADAIYR